MVLTRVETVLTALEEITIDGHITYLEDVRHEIESALQMPRGDPLVRQMLTHPYILWSYVCTAITRLPRYPDEQWNSLTRKRAGLEPKEDTIIRLRKFRSKGGYYYGIPFQAADVLYDFWEDEPILLTKISRGQLERERYGTELGWIISPEIRALAALSFSIETGLCSFHLSDKVFDLPASLILDEDTSLSDVSLRRAHLADKILTRLGMADFLGFGSLVSGFPPFQFRTEGLSPEKAKKFYDRFDITDDLALRTGFHLLKAAMLWGAESRAFQEDACANLFFGLEGCLRLIHRRINEASSFEINPTLSHIESTFPDTYYSWFLEDAYDSRIQIVHPEPRIQSGWIRFLEADDYYENYEMAIDLFYYAITGERLPRTP